MADLTMLERSLIGVIFGLFTTMSGGGLVWFFKSKGAMTQAEHDKRCPVDRGVLSKVDHDEDCVKNLAPIHMSIQSLESTLNDTKTDLRRMETKVDQVLLKL